MAADCPVCMGKLPDADPRRRWCSAACRTFVWRVGGTSRLARTKDRMAQDWDHTAQDNAAAIAKKLRWQAARLREIGGG